VEHRHSSDIHRSTPGALAPARVMLSRSIYTYAAPSAPLASTPQLPCPAGYMRRLRCADHWSAWAAYEWFRAFACVPSHPAILVCPRRVHRLLPPGFHRQDSPSSTPSFRTRHFRLFHFNPLPVDLYCGASWFACSLRPGELLASRGPDRVPHTQPTKAFTSELAVESVALLAVGYNYSGIWVPPLAGLAPAGTFASFAALGVQIIARRLKIR